MTEYDDTLKTELLPPKKGRLKIYIGMSAGVGKTYRMLQEAHILLGSRAWPAGCLAALGATGDL